MKPLPQIAILGSYPPPFGGTSTHVQRLSGLLAKRDLDHVIYNGISEGNDGRYVVCVARGRHAWMLKYALTSKERLVYVCSARLEVWMLGAFMVTRRRKRVIIRLRNAALLDYLKRPPTRALASWALRNVTRVVAVSEELAAAAREAGVPDDRIIHQPGFLPPTPTPPGEDGLTSAQREFVARHHPLVAANGKVDWYEGTDLYGLDHLIEMTGRLKTRYPDIGLTVSFWDHLPEDAPQLTSLLRRAKQLGVRDSVLMHTAPWPFVPVLAKADLFIRPTVTDGDANSVREALYLGVPTMASDVVTRPEGTIVFRTRDLEDLIAKADELLARPPARVPRPQAIDMGRVEWYLDTLERLSTEP